MILMSLSAKSVLYQCIVLVLSARKRTPLSSSLLTPATHNYVELNSITELLCIFDM